MYEALSEHSHTTAWAISSGVPILPIGVRLIRHESGETGLPSTRSIIGVSIEPGQMTLTRIPSFAQPFAADFVNPI